MTVSCLAVLLFFPRPGLAKVTVKAQVDKEVLRWGEGVQLRVIVEGARSSSQPKIPKTDEFKLTYHGQSSQFNMINGRVNSNVTFSYTIIPMKKGEITVGPVHVEHDGKRVTAPPLKLRVLSADSAVKQAEPLILRTTLSEPEPYYNQQVVYTLEFGRRVDVMDARVELPAFDGFWVEDMGKQKEEYRMINGHRYLVTELKKALFPNQAGMLSIPSALVQCEVVLLDRRRQDPFDNFFNSFRRRTTSKLLQSRPIEVKVKPLPEEGRPPDFYPLVGKLRLKTALTKKSLEAGDSTTLTLTISGDANIRDARLIEPEDPGEFKVYDDKPAVEFKPRKGKIFGKKIFKKALVPLRAGEPRLPVFRVPYFDPREKKYKVLESKGETLAVSAAAEQEKLHSVAVEPERAPRKESIKILGKDILSVYTGLEALEDKRLRGGRLYMCWLLFVLPPLVFCGLLLVRKRSRFYQDNLDVIRQKKALKKAQLKLQECAAQTENPAAFYPLLAKTIKEFVDDKLLLPGGALTPQEIEHKLKAAGAHVGLISDLMELLNCCELYRFASSDAAFGDCRHFFEQAEKVLRQLDKSIKGR